MKIDASSIEDYFAKMGEREPMLRELDKLIQKEAPNLERKLFEGMSITMISYGLFHYKTKSGSEGDWPIIALANQKNYVSVYVCATKDGKYIAEIYKNDLGKVSVGRSCIRFNKIEKVNLEALGKVIHEAATLHKSGNAGFAM
jgi:hypothetical protein